MRSLLILCLFALAGALVVAARTRDPEGRPVPLDRAYDRAGGIDTLGSVLTGAQLVHTGTRSAGAAEIRWQLRVRGKRRGSCIIELRETAPGWSAADTKCRLDAVDTRRWDGLITAVAEEHVAAAIEERPFDHGRIGRAVALTTMWTAIPTRAIPPPSRCVREVPGALRFAKLPCSRGHPASRSHVPPGPARHPDR